MNQLEEVSVFKGRFIPKSKKNTLFDTIEELMGENKFDFSFIHVLELKEQLTVLSDQLSNFDVCFLSAAAPIFGCS